MALSGESRGLEIDSVGWGGQDLIDGEVLGCEDSIETVEREGSFAVKEVRDMGLAEAGLLGESRAGEGVLVDAADEFETKALVQIGKVHRLWNSL